MFRVAFVLLFLAACSRVEETPTAKGPKRELPLAEYKDTTILSMYEGSRLSWILRTKYLVKWPRTDLVRAKPVDLVVYDSLGKTLVRVTSDSGAVDEAVSFLAASGHVHGHSEKGVDIQSDSLRWNKAINQISTEARVRVVSEEGDVLTGKGFVSDAKLDNWQILSDVKGVFQKVEERFQKADTAGTRPADTAAPIPGPSHPSTAAPGPSHTPASPGPMPGPAPASGPSHTPAASPASVPGHAAVPGSAHGSPPGRPAVPVPSHAPSAAPGRPADKGPTHGAGAVPPKAATPPKDMSGGAAHGLPGSLPAVRKEPSGAPE